MSSGGRFDGASHRLALYRLALCAKRHKGATIK
jgi:hypothetical protein